MQCPKIMYAKAIDDRTLIVHFSNEEVREYNIQPLLLKEMFAPPKAACLLQKLHH